ncbi:MAG: glycosyltransferase, partial [Chitinophagaceae bacterium]
TDRDLNSTEPYPGIPTDQWIDKDGFHVNYLSPAGLKYRNIAQIMTEVAPATIYLNSMFSLPFTIYPLVARRSRLAPVKVVLAPRGMLKPSALNFKKTKKKLFLFLGKLTGYYKTTWFHATSDDEVLNVQSLAGANAKVKLIPNFAGYLPEFTQPQTKQSGVIKFIFLGRVHPIKNLDLLLKQLEHLRGNISLTIVGSEEDKGFYNECVEIIKTLPPNINVTFAGEMEYQQVQHQIAQHHMLVLPTRGENFGHAIFEALRAGKPAIISDQTPWLDLEKNKAGWSLPLDGSKVFANAMQAAIDFDQATYDEWSAGAWTVVKEYVNKTNLKTEYQNLFD